MMHKNNNKGFTLAELLIVVAIIAVLVAIAIPVFTSQLERSREATDISNIRSYYAEITTSLLTGDLKAKNNTITVGSGMTAKLADDIPTTKDHTFTVVLTGSEASPLKFQQQVDDWQSAAFDIAGVALTKNTDGSTAGSSAIKKWTNGDNRITYTFKLAADADYYLSGIEFGRGTESEEPEEP